MGQKILVVDDDPVVIRIIEAGLKQRGYEVWSAGNSRDALRRVREGKPDLIIMDIMLPDVDGTETVRIIKEELGIGNIPIIYLTSLVEVHEEASESISGPNIVMAKPIDKKRLMAKIEELTRC